MPLCRYPKTGFVNIKEVCGEENANPVAEKDGIAEGKFIPDDESIKSWSSYKDVLLVGYWCWDWAIQRHRIESLDRHTGEIQVDKPYHTFGYRANKDGKGGRFYALNVREALSDAGEWVIDREKGIVTVIPYENQKYIDVSVVGNIFYANGVKNLTISDLDIAECRECAVRIENSSDVSVKNLTVTHTGAWGIVGEGCQRMRVDACRVSYTGGGGIAMAEEYIKDITKLTGNTFIPDDNPKPKKRTGWYHIS